MNDRDRDTVMRAAAFAQIKRLNELRDRLTASDLAAGFQFDGTRIPLINPRRGIFKPEAMQYLLSIKTVRSVRPDYATSSVAMFAQLRKR